MSENLDLQSKEYSTKTSFLCNASDLLGRNEIPLEINKISKFYKDKVIFITGASGSIGSEILRQLLQLPVKKIIAYNHGEFSCYSTIQKVDHQHIVEYIIGDIRDYNKLNYVLYKYKPDIFINAGALKHVKFIEEFPSEGLKTNILGTNNCVKASILNNVKQFVQISTDKAVNPSSIMGATKNIAEKIVLSLNKNPNIKTKFSVVRFGNVLGSRGSVIPLFKKQIENNEALTITHSEMKRYFMSISEASKLVIKSITLKKGNIFILDMDKPIKILDLAHKLIKLYGKNTIAYPINIIGKFEGEKLDEELTVSPKNLKKTKFKRLLTLKKVDHKIDYDLNELIYDFELVSETYDKNKIIEIFRKYIPNFKKR